MTHRKLLEKISGLYSKGGTEVKIDSLQSGVFNLVWIIFHRRNSEHTLTDIGPQPLDEYRSTDNNFAGYDIGPQLLDEKRPTGNKLTDCGTKPVYRAYGPCRMLSAQNI